MDFQAIKELLEDKSFDNITVLTHKNPDGDTLGAGFAMCYALRSMGKKANVLNQEPFPKRYKEFMYPDYEALDFEEEHVIAVDIADTYLLGDKLEQYRAPGKIDLCIDHHISNKKYAEKYYIDDQAAAACEIIFDLFKFMGIKITKLIATCLYIGIATDTGCFKFESVTPHTMQAGAELIGVGINHGYVNRMMFDVKPKGVIFVEQEVLNNLEFHFDDRCAIEFVPLSLIENSGVENAEFEELASIPLTVEGVEMGITIKEKGENDYKLSVRTTEKIDACRFCNHFGGGGHLRAAGCQISAPLEEVKRLVLEKAAEMF